MQNLLIKPHHCSREEYQELKDYLSKNCWDYEKVEHTTNKYDPTRYEGANFWWTADEGIDIPEKHKEALNEDALERMSQMIKEGYTSGELSTSVRYGKDIVPEEDEEDGLAYSGWWSI